MPVGLDAGEVGKLVAARFGSPTTLLKAALRPELPGAPVVAGVAAGLDAPAAKEAGSAELGIAGAPSEVGGEVAGAEEDPPPGALAGIAVTGEDAGGTVSLAGESDDAGPEPFKLFARNPPPAPKAGADGGIAGAEVAGAAVVPELGLNPLGVWLAVPLDAGNAEAGALTPAAGLVVAEVPPAGGEETGRKLLEAGGADDGVLDEPSPIEGGMTAWRVPVPAVESVED